jgi:hypothetical protein
MDISEVEGVGVYRSGKLYGVLNSQGESPFNFITKLKRVKKGEGQQRELLCYKSKQRAPRGVQSSARAAEEQVRGPHPIISLAAKFTYKIE